MKSFNHKLPRIHISSQLLQLCPPRLYRSGVRLFDSFTTLRIALFLIQIVVCLDFMYSRCPKDERGAEES